jgi:uncharacterized protein YcfJ
MSRIVLFALMATSVWAEECRLKIGSIRPIYLAVQEEPIINTSLLIAEYPSTHLYSVHLQSEQSAKKSKKGRVIGTIVGVSIGGGLGYVLYSAAAFGSALGSGDEPSPLLLIIPTIIGGIIGYEIGEYFDKR